MRVKSLLVLALALSALIATSCNKQQVAQLAPTEIVIPTPQNTATEIPTVEPTPTETPKIVAKNFENCEIIEFTSLTNNSIYWDSYDIELSQEDSHMVLENKDIRTTISKSKMVNGTVYLKINETEVIVRTGTVLYLNFYLENTAESLQLPTEYGLMYSPDLNQFVGPSQSGSIAPPYTEVTMFKNSLPSVSIPMYQEDYCIKQIERYFSSNNPDNEGKQCVIYELPNGDQYGWGKNKYGETICPSISIVEQ